MLSTKGPRSLNLSNPTPRGRGAAGTGAHSNSSAGSVRLRSGPKGLIGPNAVDLRSAPSTKKKKNFPAGLVSAEVPTQGRFITGRSTPPKPLYRAGPKEPRAP